MAVSSVALNKKGNDQTAIRRATSSASECRERAHPPRFDKQAIFLKTKNYYSSTMHNRQQQNPKALAKVAAKFFSSTRELFGGIFREREIDQSADQFGVIDEGLGVRVRSEEDLLPGFEVNKIYFLGSKKKIRRRRFEEEDSKKKIRRFPWEPNPSRQILNLEVGEHFRRRGWGGSRSINSLRTEL